MMSQEVEIVSRTPLPSPTIDKPDRVVMQIQYKAGELPPHFVYIEKDQWTKELEAKAIKEDIEKRMKTTRETISL
jgi:hypothetical protein